MLANEIRQHARIAAQQSRQVYESLIRSLV